MDFLKTINKIELDSNIRYHVLHIAQDLNLYMQNGLDPVEALDFLLGFYQAVPDIQSAIRDVLDRALAEYQNNL